LGRVGQLEVCPSTTVPEFRRHKPASVSLAEAVQQTPTPVSDPRKSQYRNNSRPALAPDVASDLSRSEDEVKRMFRSKGLDLRLNERVSVVRLYVFDALIECN
jgi:hypothetical protein